MVCKLKEGIHEVTKVQQKIESKKGKTIPKKKLIKKKAKKQEKYFGDLNETKDYLTEMEGGQ